MNTLRKARVFYDNELAGYLTETSGGYTFQYHPEFLKKNIPVSISLPPRTEPYESKEWYLHIVSATRKIDSKDSFGVLIGTASVDTIGAVTVRKVKNE